MQLKGWTAQNNETNQAPRTPVRVLQFQVTPEVAGGNPNVAGGKVVGQLSFQNLTDALAAEFAGGPEVDITITVRQPAQT
jgi:hypothetical protein